METIEEINQEYNLELNRIITEIQEIDISCPSRTRGVLKVKNNKAKRVLLQFPDGMKPYSLIIVDYLQEKVDAEFFIWFSSCFGACDLPNVSEKDFDLIIQFGHSAWE